MSDYASLLRETEEAIGAGQEAHRQAQQVLDSLRSARGWGIYDLLGGGMLSGLMKHSRMDRAQQQLESLRQALLERFNRELKDMQVQCSASAELSGFWRVADLAWDEAHQRLDGAEQDQRCQGAGGTHRRAADAGDGAGFSRRADAYWNK